MKQASRHQPAYRVIVTRPARKQLLRLPESAQSAIQAAIDALELTPRPAGVKKLKGREGYRIRVGGYRVLYAIFDKVLLIEVVKVRTRGNFYDEQVKLLDSISATKEKDKSPFCTGWPFIFQKSISQKILGDSLPNLVFTSKKSIKLKGTYSNRDEC